MEFLDKAIAFLNESAMSQAVFVAMILEFALRLTKSEKPLSILWVARDVVSKSSKLLEVFASLLDKVLPQRIEPPKE